VSRSQALGAAGVLGVVLDEIPRLAVRSPLAVKSRAMGESFKFRLRAPEASSSNVKLHLAFCERLEAKYFSYLSFRDFAQAL
jgi:hypothetical protein